LPHRIDHCGSAQENDVDVQLREVADELQNAQKPSVGKPPFDQIILARYITERVHALQESVIGGGSHAFDHDSDAPDLGGLLGTRGEWPCGHGAAEKVAAQKADEFPPPYHVPVLEPSGRFPQRQSYHNLCAFSDNSRPAKGLIQVVARSYAAI